MCWTEITWDAPHNRWNVERPTGLDYRCNIFEDEVQTAGQVGPIDGQPLQPPRTLAPSTENEEEESEHSDCDDSLSLDSRGTTGVRRLRVWRTRQGAEKTWRGAAWRYDRTQLQLRMSGTRRGGALTADRLDVGASRRMSQGGQSEGLSVVLR